MESPERYVRVLALRQEPGKADAGTGYVLSPTLVLTAAHVVESAWEGGREIRVLSDLWPEGRLAKVLWCRGARGLDAALLEVAAEERFPSVLHTLAWAPLATGVLWTSAGFARGASSRVPLKRLQGEIRSWPSAGDWFEITTSHSPRRAKRWRGISGAAILSRGTIVGVIGEVTKAFCSDIQVTSVPAILQDSRLVEALGLSPVEQRCQRLFSEVEGLLAGDKGATSALAAAGATRGQVEWPSLAANDLAAFIRAMCQASAVLVALALKDARRAILGTEQPGTDPGEGAVRSIKTLKKLSLRLFPMIYEPIMRFAQPGIAGSLVILPLRRGTLIEFAMAGYYDRPAEFEGSSSPNQHPKARASLEPPKLGNTIENGFSIFCTFACGLAAKYADTQIQVFLANDAFQANLQRSGTDQAAFIRSRTGQGLRALNRRFEYSAHHSDYPLQYYLIFDQLDLEEAGGKFVELMGEHLSAIKVFGGAGDLSEDDVVALIFRDIFAWDEPPEGSSE